MKLPLRCWLTFCALSVALALPASTTQNSAQQAPPELVDKRDYTFERLEATRAVDDAYDKGTIRLTTQIWRPVKNDRREVVFFSHGSTGALVVPPIEPAGDGPPRGWSTRYRTRTPCWGVPRLSSAQFDKLLTLSGVR